MDGFGPTEGNMIELEDVRLTYEKGDDRVTALDGVSLTVEHGERVAVIGPSGSGKSSLVQVIGGLEEADSGTIRIAGRDATGNRGREFARDVGVVFQNAGLVPQLTALQNVLCGRLFEYDGHRGLFDFEDEDRHRAASLLEQFGLGDRLGQRASKLSGGEKQRVGISRLLLQSPRLALLDEPVSNLDVHWASRAMEQLEMLGGEGGTAVIVLHDLAAVREWSDRAILVCDGEIMYDGSPDEACRRLQSLGSPTMSADGTLGRSESDAPRDGRDGFDEKPTPPTPDDLEVEGEPSRGVFYGVGILAFIAAYVWAVLGLEITAADLFGGLGSAGEFLSRLVPPDVSVAGKLFDSIVETVQMALIGTTLAAFLSLPLSILAARNVSPTPVRAVARVVLNLLRTIPSIIWGLFFVAMVGLGPLPGILALTFYASGYLGKFYYEGIESISPEPVRALKTVGASRLQQFRHGVFPQVLPLLAGYTLYMFEYNVRAASILGVVGAGGIGFYLYTYINNFQYTKATTALLMLLVVVTVIDVASSRLRRRLQD
jgi:phosphonate transport system permease protein